MFSVLPIILLTSTHIRLIICSSVHLFVLYIHSRSFSSTSTSTSTSSFTGHTNFRNAGVHVKPKIGSAVFFSYIDPDTRITDTGLTEHSGCPVLEGEKKIVTQWIRLGVDDDSPWDAFNSRKY